ncbi:hypothetical protein [Acetobacter sp. DsW_063]|uniref:hypothetical protein n=1 Tax=Acetobacter sp. DsW_063 TaxID=1514894 RepID=UPI000A364A94|nr:hypothetical protein [Acetobacter sp. DsW_063]OUJ13674.1 hypothetical protein HK28_01825 [Acetobacter sp. DsW_063]
MFESQIVEIDGTFLGTFILEGDRETRRFYATHDSVRSCHNRTSIEPGELTPQLASLFRRARTDNALLGIVGEAS